MEDFKKIKVNTGLQIGEEVWNEKNPIKISKTNH